jgi:uncharacterized protein YfeS
MKIAVTDACIFIDLIKLKLLTNFFELPYDIHTTYDVFNELYPEQKDWLTPFESVGKLVIHNLSSRNWEEIGIQAFPKALSETDKSVLYIADTLKAILLSSDGVVRRTAEVQQIECHGIFWIFDLLLESGKITKRDAILKIKMLGKVNYYYRINDNLRNEIERRLKEWDGQLSSES